MALKRGFKAAANTLSAEMRDELGLGPFDRLDPRSLAQHLEIPIIDLSSFREKAPDVAHLLTNETDVFSAVTVFAGPRRTIVHNDGHAPVRQNSNICHELSHGLLQHPPTPALDNAGCRIWNQDYEDEASWLASCLLVTPQTALATARGYMTVEEAARKHAVSAKMMTFRINATGARARVSRAQGARF